MYFEFGLTSRTVITFSTRVFLALCLNVWMNFNVTNDLSILNFILLIFQIDFLITVSMHVCSVCILRLTIDNCMYTCFIGIVTMTIEWKILEIYLQAQKSICVRNTEKAMENDRVWCVCVTEQHWMNGANMATEQSRCFCDFLLASVVRCTFRRFA